MKVSKKVLVTSCAALLFSISCASNYRRPESVEDKMSRYEVKKAKINEVPRMAPPSISYAGRGPASVTTPKKMSRPFSDLTNKRVYFLTLLSQYNDFRPFATYAAPTLAICPHFHTNVVNFNESHQKSFEKRSWPLHAGTENSYQDESWAKKYPEFYLPVTKESVEPRVLDLLKKSPSKERSQELISLAVDTHVSKIYDELKELCEYGSSDNYFTFENLTSHIKGSGKPFPPGEESLNTLLKTTLFTNKMLIDSLKRAVPEKGSRAPASMEEARYIDEVIVRLGVDWIK